MSASQYPDSRQEHRGADHDRLMVDQRRETEGFGLAGTAAQRHGMVGGALVGAVVGAVLLAPFGFIEWGGTGIGLGPRLAAMALIGLLAGAAVVAVYAGGRLPEIEGQAADPATGQAQHGDV